MPFNLSRPDDRAFDLAAEVLTRYGVKLTPLETKLLQLLVDLRSASCDSIDDHLWPDADAFETNLDSSRRVLVGKLRKKLGELVDIVTFSGQGYALRRLGPSDNPMHERKY